MEPIRDLETHTLAMLSCDIDDESPQVLAHVQARALALGALDCVLLPTLMKKGRPGTRVEILCEPARSPDFAALLLRETSTLGVREATVQRHALAREMRSVVVHGHKIRIKLASADGVPLRAQPEFEDCRAAAESLALPVRTILEEARAAALALLPEQ